MYKFNDSRSRSDRKSNNSVLIPDFIIDKIALVNSDFSLKK